MKKLIVMGLVLLSFTGVFARSQMANPLYQQSLRDLWGKIYPAEGETIYCAKVFDNSKRSARKNNLNAEHIMPASWFAKELKCGSRKQCQKNSAKFRKIEADLHNIYPANSKINQARSNYRFAEIQGEKREFGRCDFEVDRKSRTIEPRPLVRGEIARAMLYMEYTYDIPIYKKNKALLKKWDLEYPPTNEEKRREKTIQKIQGTTNPFITKYPFSGK